VFTLVILFIPPGENFAVLRFRMEKTSKLYIQSLGNGADEVVSEDRVDNLLVEKSVAFDARFINMFNSRKQV
jgi:hypothetical protein